MTDTKRPYTPPAFTSTAIDVPRTIDRDALAEACGLETKPSEAKAKGLCVVCGERALDKCYSDAGRREYSISGSCEACFDAMYAEGDLDADDPTEDTAVLGFLVPNPEDT